MPVEQDDAPVRSEHDRELRGAEHVGEVREPIRMAALAERVEQLLRLVLRVRERQLRLARVDREERNPQIGPGLRGVEALRERAKIHDARLPRGDQRDELRGRHRVEPLDERTDPRVLAERADIPSERRVRHPWPPVGRGGREHLHVRRQGPSGRPAQRRSGPLAAHQRRAVVTGRSHAPRRSGGRHPTSSSAEVRDRLVSGR